MAQKNVLLAVVAYVYRIHAEGLRPGGACLPGCMTHTGPLCVGLYAGQGSHTTEPAAPLQHGVYLGDKHSVTWRNAGQSHRQATDQQEHCIDLLWGGRKVNLINNQIPSPHDSQINVPTKQHLLGSGSDVYIYI